MATAKALPPERQLAIRDAAMSAISYAKSGRLPSDAARLLSEKKEVAIVLSEKAVETATARKEALKQYAMSGQMARDVGVVVAAWLVWLRDEASEWLLLRWEDTSDFLVVSRRRLAKVLEKVF